MPLVRAQLPDVRCEIYGDGPERADARRLAADLGLDAGVTLPGFVDHTTVEAALRRALCLALPSRREGYGLVVVEASALGTPAVVVEDPDNASVELIDEGENGVVARSASPEDLAAAIVRVAEAGPGLRASTADWFRRNARRLSLQNALGTVVERYDGGPPRNTAT
jgi:glycosyltransferase involved in cell wall biosynthesis